jgi:Holliday junction resolvase
MPRTAYQKGAEKERDILKRYRNQGMNTIRAAHSRSSVVGLDGFAWDEKDAYFVCSRAGKWTKTDIEEVISQIKMFPGSCVIFFSSNPEYSTPIIIDYQEYIRRMSVFK